MSGRCAVLRNKKEREKEERLAEKESMEQIGESGAKQEGGENRNRLASRFSRSGGVYFFAFSGKDTKRKKSRNVFIL